MLGTTFYKLWLSGSGGEQFGKAICAAPGWLSAPLGPGCPVCPWSLGKSWAVPAHSEGSGSTARAEQIQCVMQTLVLPVLLCAELWAVELQRSGRRPARCELHVQSCECVQGSNLVPIMRLESDFSSVFGFCCFYSCSVVPILLAEADCPAALSRSYCESSVSSSVRILLLSSGLQAPGVSIYMGIVLSTRQCSVCIKTRIPYHFQVCTGWYVTECEGQIKQFLVFLGGCQQ